MAIGGNYVSKIERGVVNCPNRAYRQAFGMLFNVWSDAEPDRARAARGEFGLVTLDGQ